jgi:hypothetical protein
MEEGILFEPDQVKPFPKKKNAEANSISLGALPIHCLERI